MTDMRIEGVEGGPFQTNAYLIADPAAGRAAVIDPGYDAGQLWGPILRKRGLTLESIVLTHGHIDHVTGVAAMARAFPEAAILIHEADAPMLTGGNRTVAQMYGLPPYEPAEPTRYLREGEPLAIGGLTFDVLHVPGHCPGHVALRRGDHLISGDVLFAGSIGRTDLPGGDFEILARSIVEKILPLGDEVRVYPGHGPETTIGHERRTNPFVLEMLARAGAS